MGIIELSEVTVRRGRSQVLDSWSISVDSGEVVCLSGDNGCGKSTVIETAAGLISMENGSCEISGQLIRDSQGRNWATLPCSFVVTGLPQKQKMNEMGVRYSF